MTAPAVKCPFCGKVISYLEFDVTATCTAQMYQEDVIEGKFCDMPNLLDEVQFDNFCCPECGELIAGSEDEAEEFLKGKAVGVEAGDAGFPPALGRDNCRRPGTACSVAVCE